LLTLSHAIGPELVTVHDRRLLAIIPVHARLLALGNASTSLVDSIDAHLLAVGGADLPTFDVHRPLGRTFMPLRLNHPELRRTRAFNPRIRIAVALEGERLSSWPLARKAGSTLHAERTSVAAAAARLNAGVAATAATTRLGKAPVAAMPPVAAAGLCARRRRNRQCGDARGKE
jgi:hypothetical protein